MHTLQPLFFVILEGPPFLLWLVSPTFSSSTPSICFHSIHYFTFHTGSVTHSCLYIGLSSSIIASHREGLTESYVSLWTTGYIVACFMVKTL